MPIWPRRRGPGDARCAAARCIPPAIRASRGAGPAGSGPSTIGGSASASRATPPSLRFLGRKVYLAAIVVLVAVLRHGVTTSRMERLSQAVGVDRRTVERWRRWWRDSFTATPFWREARATFMPPIDHGRVPASLLERFSGDDADRLVALLRFIGPVTGGCVHAR
jgi:hypothetical protein